MHRRRRLACAILASTLAFVAGCSGGGSEKKLLEDFFRASRLRDNVTLGNFATATFDPRTHGTVQSLEIVTVGDERVTPLPLKQYVKAVEDAKAADAAFSTEKRAYQNANIVAIDRVLKTAAAGKTVSAKDRSVKDAWDKWSTDQVNHKKAVSAAQRQLNDARGIAELSLSRPNGATIDATQYRRSDGGQGSDDQRDGPGSEGADGHAVAEGDAAARAHEGRERQRAQGPVDRHFCESGVKLLAVLGMLALAGCSSGVPPAKSADSGMRQLRGTSPSGSTSWPVVFRWEGTGGTEVVRVHVLDEAERPIFGIEARGGFVAAPQSLKAQLMPGARYQWRVARVNENGDESDASELTPFQLQ